VSEAPSVVSERSPHHAPASDAEVRDLIGAAVAARRRLEIEGGGSKRALRSPVTADAVLELRALSGVLDYDPEELVIRACAGTPLGEIETLLEERQQMLAFEPFDHALWFGAQPGRATLGGIMAANVSGPRRVSSGAARDHLLGFTAVSGRGELLKGGGAVVKNVSGFDLPKLMAGSWGTLAVLTSLTVRVVPRPPAQTTLRFFGLSDAIANRLMTAALATPAAVSAAAHLPTLDASAAETLLRLEGFGPSVKARVRLLEEHLASFGSPEALHDESSTRAWRRVIALEPLPRRGCTWWRLSVPPARGAEAGAALADAACAVLYDWGGGLVYAAVPEPAAESVPQSAAESAAESAAAVLDARIRSIARALGGHARCVQGSAAQAPAAPRPPGSSALRGLNERVKAAFDPFGILNPGLDLAAEL
jgi:glycolate oxidase FAD binding subunit